MRVIAGENKGKRIISPDGRNIRPTSDKVKGAIFNILAAEIPDAIVVDLFSGTGNLGIEALSRGARHVYFIDNSKESTGYIYKNVENCKHEEGSTILLSDYRNAARRIREHADIVLADPPYGNIKHKNILDAASEMMKPGAILVLEHDKREEHLEEHSSLVFIKQKPYGNTKLSIYKKGE